MRKRYLMNKTSEEPIILPIGYKQVEYLESTGTQRITTDIIPTSTTSVYLDFQLTEVENTRAICGGHYGNVQRFYVLHVSSNGYFSDANVRGTVVELIQADTNRHIYKFNIAEHSIKLDNTVNSTWSTAGWTDPTTGTGLGIFWRSNYGSLAPAKCKIYSCIIKDSVTNTKIGEFIPCLDDQDVPCMYDIVSKNTYYNTGTGTFNYGSIVN